ncbi:PadR family transcriptional regulator [Mollicutes bacterium LVI A0039]|nr:PadR family transcriptional regulator [Mollicutes bacterium LVI A0039]
MNTQLKKGTIELAILKFLNIEDNYGYEVGKFISKEIDVKEGTIYLILQRLEKAGVLESYLKSEENSKRRKYYKLTVEGLEYLEALLIEWKKLSQFIENCGVQTKENNE